MRDSQYISVDWINNQSYRIDWQNNIINVLELNVPVPDSLKREERGRKQEQRKSSGWQIHSLMSAHDLKRDSYH